MATTLRTLMIMFCLALPSLTAAETDAEGETVIKNAIDKRDYRVLTLSNGLRALLVSDPDTDMAAAALNINVGYFSDPEDRPGLAHFLEHMLFLGTDRYPEPEAYREFITTHGGHVNAFVSAENTVYFFDIDRSRLEGALDRFSRFFVAPLFDPAFVQREINAIDSEYRMGLRDDARRINDAVKETVNPAHPLAKFSVGNLTTLADREEQGIREAVIDFWQRHYSAGIMTLAVVGAEPVERLAEMVEAKFGEVPNTGARPARVEVPVRLPDEPPARLNIIPLREARELRFDFTFPWREEYHLGKPTAIIGHLIGHEGSGSLHELLKERGWINQLSAGGRRLASNEGVFSVSLDLTPAGIERIETIGDYLFRYIALIDRDGIKPRIHDELRRINELNFEFRESANPSGEVISLAGNLQTWPNELALFGPYHLGDFDESQIREVYAYLRPDNLRLTVIAPGIATDRISHYYQTEYGVEKIGAELLARWTSPAPSDGLAIPAPNPFLPGETRLRQAEAGVQRLPVRLIGEEGLELWHLQDSEFGVPRADLFVNFETARAVATIRDHVMTTLYLSLAKDRLNAHTYPARLAGLSYSLHGNLRGFGLHISGYDEKQPVLLEMLVDTLLELEIDPDRFEIRRAELIRQWENTRLGRPFIQLHGELQTLLHASRWTSGERIEALRAVTREDLQRFIPALLAQVRLEVFIHGNLTADDAVEISRDLAARVFDERVVGERVTRAVARLTPGRQFLNTLAIDHDDAAVVVHYQAPDDEIGTAARVMLLEQVIKSPFFDTLRTHEQLGYVVIANSGFNLRVPGLNFIIQSPVAGPTALVGRVDDFLGEFAARLSAMDDKEFAGYRDGLLTVLRERDTSLNRRSQRLQGELALGHDAFDRRELLAAAAGAITREELLEFYQDWLLSEQRRRIVLQAPGNRHAGDALDHERHGFEMIPAPEAFRKALPSFRL